MPIKLLFASTLMIGTLITISATNWISMWVGLELNLISFIPLILQGTSQATNEAALKYFLTQTFASIILLFSMIFLTMINYANISVELSSFITMLDLALKMGAAPLHFWFPSIIQGMSWTNCFVLMTWQKLAPLFLLMMFSCPQVSMIAICSAIIGAVGGYGQMSSKKILAYSSINHLSWLTTSTMISEKLLMLLYFLIYSFLNCLVIFMMMKWNIQHLSQIPNQQNKSNINLLLSTNMLSLGGIPPFLGFLPKWTIITMMINKMPLQILIMTMSSLLTLYFYLRISYTMMLKSPSHSPLFMIKQTPSISILTMISAFSLLIITPLL